MQTHVPNTPRLPDALPGRFCVVEYRRDEERYFIHVDDEARSCYHLCDDDLQTVIWRFEFWGFKDKLVDACDFAREFGSAQFIFSDGRIIPLFDREAVVKDETRKSGVFLPALKG